MSKENRPSNRLAGPVLSGYLTFPMTAGFKFHILCDQTVTDSGYHIFQESENQRFLFGERMERKNREQQRGSPRDNHRLDQQLQCELYNMNMCMIYLMDSTSSSLPPIA